MANALNDNQKCSALFQYLGRDYLRRKLNTSDLRCFASMTSGRPSFSLLVEFLDGDDHWLRKNITTGKQLAEIVGAVSSAQPHGTPPAILKQQWAEFITRYLSPDWANNLLNNTVALNGFLREFGDCSETIVFLETYLKIPAKDLNDIIAVFNLDLSEFKTESSETTELGQETALALIRSVPAKTIYEILLQGKKFDSVLSDINCHRDRDFARALFYGLTKAVHWDRAKDPRIHQTMIFGMSFGVTRWLELQH